MSTPIQAGGLRRADFDFTGRTRPVIDVLLRQLRESANPVERQNIVDRLTSYVRGFDEEQVDFARLNAGLKAEGFPELAHTPPAGVRRPLSELDPASRAALDRAQRFYTYEIPSAARTSSTAGQTRLAELGRMVKANCGDHMSEDEFRTAMSMLHVAR